jgi:hypothetical protein
VTHKRFHNNSAVTCVKRWKILRDMWTSQSNLFVDQHRLFLKHVKEFFFSFARLGCVCQMGKLFSLSHWNGRLFRVVAVWSNVSHSSTCTIIVVPMGLFRNDANWKNIRAVFMLADLFFRFLMFTFCSMTFFGMLCLIPLGKLEVIFDSEIYRVKLVPCRL